MKSRILLIVEKLKQGRKYILPSVSVILIFILLGFAEKSHHNRYCKGLFVDILDEEEFQFISKRDVQEMLTNHESQPIAGKNISTIHLHQIENRLLQNSFIKDAQAYLNLKSELHVKVHQRVPVLRVLNERNEQYYIDSDGKSMPLSPNFTAHVPIATASFLKADKDSIVGIFNSELYKLAIAIRSDKFMNALCGQITVDNHYEFSIIPRLGKAEILLGDTSDLKNKFVRLKSFYKTSFPQAGWGKYRDISVKFKNQVIANKETNGE